MYRLLMRYLGASSKGQARGPASRRLKVCRLHLHPPLASSDHRNPTPRRVTVTCLWGATLSEAS